MKHFVTALILALTLAVCACAQDAIVIVLTHDEMLLAKAANDKLIAAQKDFDALKDKLLQEHRDKDAYLPQGSLWRFSTDFSALVPHWTSEESRPRCSASLSPVGVITTPANMTTH